jgi:hypothetical protein
MRVVAALLAIFFNLWALIFGFRDLSTWLQARFGGSYRLDLEWTSSGLLLLGWFAAVVAISVYPVVKPKTSGSVVVLPILIGLVAMTNVPSNSWFAYGAEGMARNRAISNAERLRAFVQSWPETHDKFPSSDAELQEVFRQIAQKNSPYAYQGAPLSPRAVFVGNAKGPVLQPTLPQPGVLYYAINDAGDHFWITLSVLDAPSSEKAVILRAGDELKVLEGELPKEPKSEEPKPEAPNPKGSKPRGPKQVDAPPSGKKPEAR